MWSCNTRVQPWGSSAYTNFSIEMVAAYSIVKSSKFGRQFVHLDLPGGDPRIRALVSLAERPSRADESTIYNVRPPEQERQFAKRALHRSNLLPSLISMYLQALISILTLFANSAAASAACRCGQYEFLAIPRLSTSQPTSEQGCASYRTPLVQRILKIKNP